MNDYTYLTLHGIPSNTPPQEGSESYTLDPLGGYTSYFGDNSFVLEDQCIRMYDDVTCALFGDKSRFDEQLYHQPIFISEAGLSADSPISRQEFETAIANLPRDGLSYKFLYTFDCFKLISGIQECNKEVAILVGEFYRILNSSNLSLVTPPSTDTVYRVSSPHSTILLATLSMIFIRLHSLFDYVTKLAFEIENIRKDFSKYPRLSCSKMQYGDWKKLKTISREGTIFERTEPMIEVEAVRNFIVHNGQLDHIPSVYIAIIEGRMIEKFVLFPDRTNGTFDRFKNRTLFYGREDKINLRLPALVKETQRRLVSTLKSVRALLADQ